MEPVSSKFAVNLPHGKNLFLLFGTQQNHRQCHSMKVNCCTKMQKLATKQKNSDFMYILQILCFTAICSVCIHVFQVKTHHTFHIWFGVS